MPINFEPAQPLDVNAAAAYGANQSFQQALPAIAQLYSSAGRMNAEAGQHAADRNARGQEAVAGLSLRNNEFHDQQAQQAQRDVYESTRGFEMQQQRHELASWLNNQELTQKETLRLQAMSNAVADVTANDELSGEEKQNLVMKLKTGIDVYKQRQERAMAAQEEAHAKAYVEQAARQTKIANGNAATSAQTIEQRTSTVYDAGEVQRIRDKMGPGATEEAVKAEALRQGAYSQVLHNGVDQYGNIKDHVLDGHGRSGKGAGKAAAEKPVTRFGDEHGVFSYALAEKEAKARAEAKYPKVGGKVNGEQVTDINERSRAEQYQEEIRTLEAEHKSLHGPGSVGGGGPGSGQIPPAGEPEMKPFETNEKANPKQKAVLDFATAQVENIKKLPIPEEAKDDYARAVRVTLGMLREYGRVDAAAMAKMSEKDREALTAAGKTIDRIEAMTFQGPTAPSRSFAPPWVGGRFDGGKQ